MAHPSTLRALRTRAIQVAAGLRYWRKELLGAMGRQKINLYPSPGALYDDLNPDDLIAVTLTLGAWRRLIDDMQRYAEEIRKFSN
jgi:hypothetical protein